MKLKLENIFGIVKYGICVITEAKKIWFLDLEWN